MDYENLQQERKNYPQRTAQIGSGAKQLSEGYAQAQQGVEKLNGSSTALIDGASSLANRNEYISC